MSTARNIADLLNSSGQIVTGKIADDAIVTGKIADSTIVNADISGSAGITGGKLADQTIIYTKIADSTITGVKLANGTVTGTQIAGSAIASGNIANSAVTAAKIAAAAKSAVKSNHYYTNPMNVPGAHAVTGVGFQPDAVIVQQIENRGPGGISWGFATGTDEHCMTAYSVGTSDTGDGQQRYDDQSNHLWYIWSNSASNHVQATLTSMDSDGFTFTITETGTYGCPAGTIQFMCFKA